METSPLLDDVRPATRAAVEAARRGLELARERSGADEITSKGGRDLVTATDMAVEDEIRRILASSADHPVVGEERGGEPPADGSPYWFLDPICGTRNFASGIPLYSVNLALVEDGRITVAVVGDASTGEIQLAEQGGRAWAIGPRGRRRLAVGEQSETIVVESGGAIGARLAHAARFTHDAIAADRWNVRTFSSTLSSAYVAAGRVAAYVLVRATALHAGAGTLLVTEAGGGVTDIDGASWTVDSDSLLACATPELHRDLVEMVAAAANSG